MSEEYYCSCGQRIYRSTGTTEVFCSNCMWNIQFPKEIDLSKHYYFPPKGQGWACPKCNKVYSPSIMECYKCNSKV